MVRKALDDLVFRGQAPLLEPFRTEKEAVFHAYRREDATIPALPTDEDLPSLLLYDLENESHKENNAYKYIDKSQKIGPIGLYGTSGAGKTRTALEYLAHNYGFNLVVDKTDNPGSFDVMLMLQSVEKKLEKIDTTGSLDSKKTQSKQNLEIVLEFLETLVCVRHAVFEFVDATLRLSRRGDGITCYEWLLLQLYPDKFLGCDVFRNLCDKFFFSWRLL